MLARKQHCQVPLGGGSFFANMMIEATVAFTLPPVLSNA